MIEYILIGLGVVYRIYVKYLRPPKYTHPDFSPKIRTSWLFKFHAIQRPFLTRKNSLIDVLETPIRNIGLYEIYTYTPGSKSDVPTNEGVILQIKDSSFNFGEEICITNDINNDYWSKFFVIGILPLLFFGPFLLLSIQMNEQSIYTIATRHETYTIPMRMLRTLGILLFISFLKYFFSWSYTGLRIPLEDTSFESRLDVFSSDEIHTRTLLSPERMQILSSYFSIQKLPLQHLLQSSTDSRNTQSLLFFQNSVYAFCTNPQYHSKNTPSLEDQNLLHHLQEVTKLIHKLGFIKDS